MKTFGRVDAQNVLEVYETATKAVEYARKKGPVLIEHLTYRFNGHGVSDRSFDKRFAEELEDYKINKDPITLLRNHIVDNYKNIEGQLDGFHEEVLKIVDESVEFAKNSPDPTYDDLINNVYVEE